MVLIILNVCVQDFCHVWSDQSQFMAVCMVFSLQIGPAFFKSVFQKPLSCSTLGLDLFSGANLNKFTVSVVPSDLRIG